MDNSGMGEIDIQSKKHKYGESWGCEMKYLRKSHLIIYHSLTKGTEEQYDVLNKTQSVKTETLWLTSAHIPNVYTLDVSLWKPK